MHTGDTIPTPASAVLDSVQPSRFPYAIYMYMGVGGEMVIIRGQGS